MILITPEFGIIFWQTTTFLVLLLVLSKFAWKPILKILKEREDAVASALDKINQAQLLIKQVDYDRSRLIKEAYIERERILDEALSTQRSIIDQANQDALAIKEKILKEAKIEITKEEARALKTLKSNIGSLVIQVSEKLLVKRLSKDTSQLELIEQLIGNENTTT